MNLANVKNVKISNVEFYYNIFQNSNLLAFSSIFSLSLTSLTFSYNYSPQELILISQNSLSMTVDYLGTYQNMANIYIQNTIFLNNTASSLISASYQNECQNILLTGNTFNNTAGLGDLILFNAQGRPSQTCLYGGNKTVASTNDNISIKANYLNITNSIFYNNYGSTIINIQNFGNHLLTGLNFKENGISLDPNSVTLAKIMNISGYLSKNITSPKTTCSYLISESNIYGLDFYSNNIHNNTCSLISMTTIETSFVFENSNFTNNSIVSSNGFITLSSNANMTITNLGFNENSLNPKGQGMLILQQPQNNTTYTINDTYFYNCTDAIYAEQLNSLTIINLNITDSKAVAFGMLKFSGNGKSNLTIENSTVTNGIATAISLSSPDLNAVLNISFSNITFSYMSGSNTIYCDSALYLSDTSIITDVTFKNSSSALLDMWSISGILTMKNSYIGYNKNALSTILSQSTTKLILDSCKVEYNQIYIISILGTYSSAYFETKNCTFQNNSATIFVIGGANFTDYGSTFKNNSGSLTSIIYISTIATAFMYNSLLENNYVNGSGIIYLTEYSYLQIANSNFINNIVKTKGGAIFSETDSVLDISNCSFISNSAKQGSALYSQHCSNISSIKSSIFKYNNASNAGCITLLESYFTITSSNFTSNTAANIPSIYLIYFSTANISNSNFALNNSAGTHIGLESGSTANISNSDFTDSSASSCSVFKVLESFLYCNSCTIENAYSISDSSIYSQHS